MERNGSNGQSAGMLERTREEANVFWSDVIAIQSDLKELAAKEVELLGAEVAESAGHAKKGAMFGGVAAIFGLIFLSFVFVTLMLVLDEFLPLWAAALITTGVLGLILGVVGFIAYSHIKAVKVTPERTINSLKEDASWAKTLMTSNKK